MKQLLIGPKLNNDKVTIGGSEVLFENWVDYCIRHDLEFDLIDGNKFNYRNKIIALISICWQILAKCNRCDVVFLHGSLNDYLYLSPWIALCAKIFRKPFYMKKFGGNFHVDYDNAPLWKRLGVKWAMKNAAGLFWELKALLPFGRRFNNNSIWIPNTRLKPASRRGKDKPYCRRFVFMSHVRKEKGIDEMLSAFDMLGDNYQLDIYGTLMGYTPEMLGKRYKGVVPAKDVPSVLSQYDCLVLDSYFEGYPGIIIEAFGVGLPVIASNAGGIPEIITDNRNGVLCQPKSTDSLVKSIRRFETMDYQQLCESSARSFDNFEGEHVNLRLYEIISNHLNNH